MKNYSILLLFILQFACCNKMAMQETYDFPVKIKEVYYQNWIAGVRGGGSGTNLYIEFEDKLPQDLVLKQLYFRQRKDSVRTVDERNYVVAFSGTANWEKENETSENGVPKLKTVKSPIKISDSEAVLEFTQKGKRKLFKIINITEKEMLAYPSAPPRN